LEGEGTDLLELGDC